jgi:hypothetical protein
MAIPASRGNCFADAEQQNANTQRRKEIPLLLSVDLCVLAPLRLCVPLLHPFDLAKQLLILHHLPSRFLFVGM